MSAAAARSAVSVVVPSYNRAHCLAPTVESILAQTTPPLEVIVVDDGSQDDTRAVCERFPAPVRYVWRANGGPSAARNMGMRAAQGEYIAFLDADDLWEPDKLEVQLALHAAHPEIGWSITNHRTTDRENQLVPGAQGFARDLPAFTETGMDPEALFAQALSRSEIEAAGRRHVVYTGDAYELMFDGNLAFPSCVMLRRGLMDRAGVFDETLRCAVDTEYFHRLAAAAPLGVIMTPLFRWRRGESNTIVSSRNMIPLVQTALLSIERATTLRGTLTPRAETRYLEGKRRLLLRLAYMQLTELDGAAARASLRRAWAQGAPVSVRAAGIYGASLLPRWALGGLRRLKQGLRS